MAAKKKKQGATTSTKPKAASESQVSATQVNEDIASEQEQSNQGSEQQSLDEQRLAEEAEQKRLEDQANSQQQEFIRLKSKSPSGFRRAGIDFTPEYQDINVEDLSDQQKDLLEKELALGKQSNLIAEEITEKAGDE